MGAAYFENGVSHQAHDQADAQLKQESLGRAGHIGCGQVAYGHADGTCQAAPETAQQQGRQHAEYIAEVKSRFARTYGNINLEHGKADIAQRCHQARHGQPLDVFLRLYRADQRVVQSLRQQQQREKQSGKSIGIRAFLA